MAPPVTATVIATGTPTLPVSGAVIVIVGAADTVTVVSPLAAPAIAVTVAVWVVVSVVRAIPFESESAVVELSVPFDVVKRTDTPGSGLFAESRTSAETVTVPPLCETLFGTALTAIEPAAAAPILTSTPPELLLPEPVRAGPENAWMIPVPEDVPARKVEVAMPLTVGASGGFTEPI
ncbi:MAG TPA: hypothetical protein VL919_01260, partial [Vicinamibacterales bacterium]|nr:hypothetical protein [Vicinamibacterales bacterium]